jgi:hypothetical protein
MWGQHWRFIGKRLLAGSRREAGLSDAARQDGGRGDEVSVALLCDQATVEEVQAAFPLTLGRKTDVLEKMENEAAA